MTEKELRKEFDNWYDQQTTVMIKSLRDGVFDFFWKRLSEKEELLKSADEVINQCAVGFSGYKEALEKYEKLKK